MMAEISSRTHLKFNTQFFTWLTVSSKIPPLSGILFTQKLLTPLHLIQPKNKKTWLRVE